MNLLQINFVLIATCFSLNIAVSQKDSVPNTKDYFEGYMVQFQSFKTKKKDISENSLIAVMGYKLVTYYKDGMIKKECYGIDDELLFESLFMPEKGHTSYWGKVQGDTIFWYNCNSNNDLLSLLEMKQGKEKKILNFKCKSVTAKYKAHEQKGTIEYTYFYSSEFPVDINTFHVDCQDSLVKYTQSMYLEMETKGLPYFDKKLKLIQIKREIIDPKIFQINKDFPLVEIK